MPDTPSDPPWDKLRAQLLILAKAQIGPKLRARGVDPSDIVHETLYQALRDRASVHTTTQAGLEAWVRGILFNRIKDAAKKAGANWVPLEQSSQRLQDLLAASNSSPSERAMMREMLARLGDALERLPGDQRTAVEIKHLHGWRVRAIAAEMGRSEVAVAGLLRRGLKTLRELLREA
ncbi:MAG: sigma-70 family RNA polymerase sigma factor [Gemmataceae bacterium]